MEAAIGEAEQRLKDIQAAYATPGFFDGKTPAELTTLRSEEQDLARRIDLLMTEWESIELESAQLENI